jgi:hypothetical protein
MNYFCFAMALAAAVTALEKNRFVSHRPYRRYCGGKTWERWDRGHGSRDDRDSQPRSSSEHLCRLARKLRRGPRRPGDGDEFRAHILPTLAHQTTCLSVDHCDVFLQVEPFQPPELQGVEIAQITSAMVEVARLVG